MELHCPHCRNAVRVTVHATPEEIVCPACGSTFRLEDLETTAWTPAKSFGRFEVIELIGQGAFGSVFKARDTDLERIVALKVPRGGNLAGPEDLQRFLREARSVAQLRHPSIVSVHEVGTSDNVPFLVSDFVEGITLADWLSAHRPTFAQAAELVAQVAEALQYAHERGVIHRDIKPSNIMLEPRKGGGLEAEPGGRDSSRIDRYAPRLMDFGLAKRHADDVSMTVDGQLLGTPAYMSPEQARGEAHLADSRCDTYSLGVIFYQLLTGELPFRGTPRMLVHQVMHDDPRRPRSLNDNIPRDLETICLMAMAKEPGQRYATAQELAADLRRFLAGKPIKARPVGAVERTWRWAKRRPALASLVLLLTMVLTVGLPGLTVLWLQAKAARKGLEEQRDVATSARALAEDAGLAARQHLYGARANLIQNAWKERQLGQVRQLLDLQAPTGDQSDLRGFEWHYFRRLVQESQITLTGHADTVTAIAFSPDRRYLASGSQDGALKIWELPTRLEWCSFVAKGGSVAGVAIAPKTRRLASVTKEGTVQVWEIPSGKELFSLVKQAAGPNSVTFSPDGKLLAVAGPAGAAVYDADGKEVASFKGHGSTVLAVAFSPDGRRVVSSGLDGTARVWEYPSGKELDQVKVTPAVNQVAFIADGRPVMLNAVNGSLAIWLPGQAGSIRSWPFPQRTISALSNDGRQMAYLAEADEVRVIDPATGREIFALRGPGGPITRIAFSADGARVATASTDHTIKLWSAGSFELDLQQVPTHAGEIFAVVFSPDGKGLASGGADGALRVREAQTGQETMRVQAHAAVRCSTESPDRATHVVQGTSALAYSRDGLHLATGGADGVVRTWDTRTGKPMLVLPAHGTAASGQTFHSGAKNTVTGVAFSPDGKLLASSSWDKTVKIWDAATGQLLHTLAGHTREATRVAFSPNGTQLASSGWDQTIRLWDVATGKPARELRWVSRPGHVDPIDSLSFRPDGKYLAAAPDQFGPGGEVKVFDLETGNVVHDLPGHIYGIFQVVFSADGQRLASCSCDGGVKIWDMHSGQELFSYHNHSGPPGFEGAIDTRRDAVHSVAMSPDGMHLALGCRNGNLLLFDASAATPEVLVEREAYRVVDGLFDKLGIRTNVLQQLTGDQSLSQPLREEALRRAARYLEDSEVLNKLSWAVVSKPGCSTTQYKQALLQIQEACRLAPDRGDLLNTLGVAEYRNGAFKEALETLTQSEKSQTRRFNGEHPADVTFLAMAHHRLGHKAEAKAMLDRSRETVKKRWSRDPEALAFLKEAETLLHEPLPVSKSP